MALNVICTNKGCCNCKDKVCLIEWTGCPKRQPDQEPVIYVERPETIYY